MAHHLTHSTDLFYGPAYDGAVFDELGKKGAPFTPIHKISLGTPLAADDNYLVDGATSTKLPATASTQTWTTADDGASPFDNADTPTVTTLSTADGSSVSVWPLDVPRNLVCVVTHATAVVAMTIVITGYDRWGYKLKESFSITAGTTSKTAAGKKAFASVESIAITVAADVTANTLKIGIGDVLGVPFAIGTKSDVLRVFFGGAMDDSVTVVAAVTTTASATTGDVRGTIDTNSACDGASEIELWMAIDPTNAETLRGVAQYVG